MKRVKDNVPTWGVPSTKMFVPVIMISGVKSGDRYAVPEHYSEEQALFIRNHIKYTCRKQITLESNEIKLKRKVSV
jgi:hypothetical protein